MFSCEASIPGEFSHDYGFGRLVPGTPLAPIVNQVKLSAPISTGNSTV